MPTSRAGRYVLRLWPIESSRRIYRCPHIAYIYLSFECLAQYITSFFHTRSVLNRSAFWQPFSTETDHTGVVRVRRVRAIEVCAVRGERSAARRRRRELIFIFWRKWFIRE